MTSLSAASRPTETARYGRETFRAGLLSAALHGALIAGAFLTLNATTEANASTGLTGAFDPVNWSLVNTNPGRTDIYQNGTYGYICNSSGSSYEVGCISNASSTPGANPPNTGNPITNPQTQVINPMQTSGTFHLIGSDANYPGGPSSSGTASTTEFKITLSGGTNYQVTFNYAYLASSQSGPDTQFEILINGNSVDSWSANCSPDTNNCTDTGSVSLVLFSSQTLSFRITTWNDGTTTPSMNISGFSTNAVPGPVPAMGAATAFSFSRRLRKRSRDRDKGVARAPRTVDFSQYLPICALNSSHNAALFDQQYTLPLSRPFRIPSTAHALPSPGSDSSQAETSMNKKPQPGGGMTSLRRGGAPNLAATASKSIKG